MTAALLFMPSQVDATRCGSAVKLEIGASVEKILRIPKRERETNILHHGQTDDLGARLKVAKGLCFVTS
jgi:hypothetical protein